MVVYSEDQMTQYTPWANVDFFLVLKQIAHVVNHYALRGPLTQPFHI